MVREDFGSFMLKKFGWEDGKGLGKDENGISRPLSLASQQDSKGIGFDSKQFEPWWDGLYNKTAANIITAKKDKKDKKNRTDKTKREKKDRRSKDKTKSKKEDKKCKSKK